MGVGTFFKKAAPWLGTLAGIAVPGAAPFVSIAAKLLTDGFGKAVPATQQGLSDAITEAMSTSDGLAKLREIDNQFAAQMKLMDIQSAEHFEQMAVDDRANARNREIEVKDLTPRILAFAVVILCFTGEALYFFRGAPSNAAPELIGRILGTLDSALMLVLAYYFGSSAGSDKKTQIMADAASAAAGKS